MGQEQEQDVFMGRERQLMIDDCESAMGAAVVLQGPRVQVVNHLQFVRD